MYVCVCAHVCVCLCSASLVIQCEFFRQASQVALFWRNVGFLAWKSLIVFLLNYQWRKKLENGKKSRNSIYTVTCLEFEDHHGWGPSPHHLSSYGAPSCNGNRICTTVQLPLFVLKKSISRRKPRCKAIFLPWHTCLKLPQTPDQPTKTPPRTELLWFWHNFCEVIKATSINPNFDFKKK